MPKVSEAHKERVRTQIVDAAAAVMSRGGPEATTTRAILDEAGVSAGTLYNYFPSKAALLAAVGEHLLRRDWAEVSSSLSPDLPDGGFRALLDAVVLSTENAESTAAGVRLRSSRPSDEEEREALQRLNRAAVELGAEAVASGQDRSQLDADLDAEALVELLDLISGALIVREAQGTWATSHARVAAVLRTALDRAVFTSTKD